MIPPSADSPLHLLGGDRSPVQTPFGGERATVGLLVARQRRRHCGDRVGVLTEGAMRDRGEKCTVRATTERDDHPFEAAQFGDEHIEFRIQL